MRSRIVGALLGAGLLAMVLLGVTMSPAGVEVEYQVTSACVACRAACLHARMPEACALQTFVSQARGAVLS